MNYRNNSIILLKKIKQFFLLMPFLLLSGCANMGSLSDISNLLKPTSVDQVTYTPVCEKSWIGKTVFLILKQITHIGSMPLIWPSKLRINSLKMWSRMGASMFRIGVQVRTMPIKLVFAFSIPMCR